MECGRTVSPCPHAHSTSVVDLTMASKPPPSLQQTWNSLHGAVIFLGCSPSRRSGILVHSHAQDFPGFTHAFFPLRICGWCGCIHSSQADLWVLRCCYSCSKLGAVRSLSPMIFPVESHFYAHGLCVSFLTDCGPCICFPLCFTVWCKFPSCTDCWSRFPML